jgi:23S rRNA (cytidine1920-2'-O)/16S rRNA (cytidine1409-2'-O)-methyltransferase
VGRSGIGKGGIVRDEKKRAEAVNEVVAFAAACGLTCDAVIPSPIRGGDGNVEYLALFVLSENEKGIDAEVAIKAASLKY